MFGINPKRIVVKININKNNSFIVIKYGTNKVHHSLVVADQMTKSLKCSETSPGDFYHETNA